MKIELSLLHIFTAAIIFAFNTGCKRDSTNDAESAVPVETIRLAQTDPARELRLTGAATPWKQENIGFQVAGRVQWVVEEGTELEQVNRPADSRENPASSVIARLDPAPYKRIAQRLESAIAAHQAGIESITVKIDNLLPQEEEQARAEFELAQNRLARIQQLVEDGAVPAFELDKTVAEYRIAQARVNAVSARISALKAEKRAIEANLSEAEQELAQARADLEHSTLTAPFSGQVAEVFIIPGGYVQAGEPVVNLVVMDPLKIELSVSAATDRHIHYGDEMMVFPPDWPEPVSGTVFHKATAADPRTRTFLVTVLMRNFKVAADLWSSEHLQRLLADPALNVPTLNRKLAGLFPHSELAERVLARQATDEALNRELAAAVLSAPKLQAKLLHSLHDLPAAEDVWPLQRSDAGNRYEEPGFIAVDALYRDENDAWYTWQVVNLQYGQPHKSLLQLRRVEVVPGEEEISLLGLFRFRRLTDTGGLGAEDLVASGVSPNFEADTLLARFIRQRWLFRPGQLLPVAYGEPGPGPGIYVPARAVISEMGKRYVFLVEQREETRVAVRTPVSIKGRLGEKVFIEGEGIEPGRDMVVSGQHYLADGHPVNVVELFRENQ